VKAALSAIAILISSIYKQQYHIYMVLNYNIQYVTLHYTTSFCR